MSHHTPTAQGDLLALVVDTHRPDELEQPTLLDALEPEVDHEPAIERTGSSDYGHVRGTCSCGWAGRVWHSRRTVEGPRLAQRDAAEHVAARSR